MEEKYAALFLSKVGYPAKPFRLVTGALLIQKLYDCSDRELVQMIRENPCMQFFCGYQGYDSSKVPFNASALVGFRKRLTSEALSDFNNMVIELNRGAPAVHGTSGSDDDNTDDPLSPGSGADSGQPAQGGSCTTDSATAAKCEDQAASVSDGSECCAGLSEGQADAEQEANSSNSGTLTLDATCAPSYIRYPQDTSLLNEAREKAEGIIDRLHEQTGGRKPRTYRIKAAKQYKSFVRKRKLRRKAIHRLLGYPKRDLEAIEKLRSRGAVLSDKDAELLDTLQKVYEQQKYMYPKFPQQFLTTLRIRIIMRFLRTW